MVTLIDTLNMENGYCDNRTWLYYKLVEHISACICVIVVVIIVLTST